MPQAVKNNKNQRLKSIPAVLLLALLTGCATAAPQDPTLPPPIRSSLWDLSLYQGFDRWQMPYFNALVPLPAPRPDAPDLILTRLGLVHIPDHLGWLRAYDFNCDRTLDTGEWTQAWLIRTAEINTGNLYGPYALLGPTWTAALSSQNAGLQRLAGLYLPRQERVLVRAALDKSEAGQSLNRELMASIDLARQSIMQRDGSDPATELSETPAPPSGPPGGTPPGQGGTPPGQGGTPPGGGEPPGGTPPGQGGTPPGQGGNPPGGGKPDKSGLNEGPEPYLPFPALCMDETIN